MNPRFEAKLKMPPGAVAPDFITETDGPVPHEKFIVSRDHSGAPKSLYGDLSWDFSAYYAEGKTVLLWFNFWGTSQPTNSQLAISCEMKRAVFCLMWRRRGAPLAIGTLRNYLFALSTLAQHADATSTSIGSVIGNRDGLFNFISTRGGWLTETLLTLLNHFKKIGPAALGFNVVDDKTIHQLRQQNKDYRDGIKQHPPIPTRIYSKLISGLIEELDKWKAVADELLEVARYCSKDPRIGRNLKAQRQISKQLKIPHQEFLPFEELISTRAIAYIKDQNKPIGVGCLSPIIGQVQYYAKTIIEIFSGMRDDEANSLPYHCSMTSESSGIRHFIIKGRTTKFNHGLAERCQWVTNKEGHMAIEVARHIADSIYEICGAIPQADPGRINIYPLFVSVGYFGFAGSAIARSYKDVFALGSMTDREFPLSCTAAIEEEDLLQLEHIDPHRPWRSEEKFKVGATWHFTSHQFRRSLALYAQRSGLVSLPSLRRQLKHITDEMARYYGRGSEFAVNFIGNNRHHFGLEWQATQAESSGLSYILNVLSSDDVLFGAHTQWLQQRMTREEGIILGDRSITLKRFQKGEMAYKETILGGCTNVGACDKVAVRWLHTACVTDNCKNLVGKLSKLELVIKAQENLVQKLDSSTVQYRTEIQDLQSLIEARERIITNNKKKELA